jgi:hypothetical protein
VLTSQAAIKRLAREMIERHGADAALRAVERLNDRIDQGDLNGRDTWAAVVHAIHELQRTRIGSLASNSPDTARPHDT